MWEVVACHHSKSARKMLGTACVRHTLLPSSTPHSCTSPQDGHKSCTSPQDGHKSRSKDTGRKRQRGLALASRMDPLYNEAAADGNGGSDGHGGGGENGYRYVTHA